MDKNEIISKLKEILSGKINLNISENQVDIKTQMEYFEYAAKHRKKINKDIILENRDNLFDKKIGIEEKRKLLIALSSIDKVEAYRTIEKYTEVVDKELEEWSKLALQESKMLIESTLLGENQVFISTGLGGKDGKFRYFASFFCTSEKFSATQRQVIKKEFNFFSDKFNSVIEEIKFRNDTGFCTFCLPLDFSPHDFIKTIIDECNKLGKFIEEKYLMTNVQKFSFKEIKSIKLNKISNEKD